jgi:hypothetical protein
MKKISEWADAVREAEKRELSKLQQSYQEYFSAKLKKYGVESPADLSADKKSEFFSEITKDWEKGQGASESGKKDVKEFGVSEGNFNYNLYLNEEILMTHPDELKDFLNKNQSHFATFLKGKYMAVNVTGDILTIKPKSGSFTITVDTKKGTIDSTGKPSHPESTSYGEIMSFLKYRTKFTVLNEGNAWMAARAKAIEEGLDEFEFNGKVYPVFQNEVSEAEINKADIKKMIKDETKELESKVKKAETAAKDAEQKAKDAEAESKGAIKDAKKAQDRAGKGTIENKEDFREYAMKILKKQHPDNFDEEIANKVIDGLAKDAEKSGDWGSAIGRLNKG